MKISELKILGALRPFRAVQAGETPKVTDLGRAICVALENNREIPRSVLMLAGKLLAGEHTSRGARKKTSDERQSREVRQKMAAFDLVVKVEDLRATLRKGQRRGTYARAFSFIAKERGVEPDSVEREFKAARVRIGKVNREVLEYEAEQRFAKLQG